VPEPVRTRFAPSPTGPLHLGNVRTAVLNWLFARRHGGAFVLRIEDTDAERSSRDAESAILEDLRWLGLGWDEGPDVGGAFGPYRQTERLASYRRAADCLLEAGAAYRCYCTDEELETRKRAALAAGRQPHYDGRCRTLTRAQEAALRGAGRTAAIRFRVPERDEVRIEDAVKGTVRFDAAELGDFIVLRSEGLPTYNFAVVVDDAAMRISHVIRGAGHLSNTPRQQLLYEALGEAAPVFAHIPQVLGPDRQKLSKRAGARAVADYRREGYPPDALVNYLSLLSWSNPQGDDFLTREQLIRDVALERVGVADVVFDPGKLEWLAGKHVEALPLETLVTEVARSLRPEQYPFPAETLPVALAAVRTHLTALGRAHQELAVFLAPEPEAARQALAAYSDRDAAERVLRAAARQLAEAPWDEASLRQALQEVGRETGAKGRALYEPLRLALTAQAHGPPLPAILAVRGRTATLALLQRL
jgi:nondiscriminating glutamyl-tRNA synthetase